MTRCPFCAVSAASGFNVIWEDAEFVVFKDRKPAAAHHLQLIPKRHIASVRSLTKNDVELVRSMQALGNELLDGLNVPPASRVMGFHIPPFNSVSHLHLHVQGLPYKPLRSQKYHISKGFGRFYKGRLSATVQSAYCRAEHCQHN
ncbi:Oxalate decarboxylase [Mycena indigotica]|uniref:Oxalate decarboxylase n=1 Tax=Mycena indigotica TaxID=2126181 RepID=A0A8H6T8K0_9AGAR|nr:Oxalate decarboxylase [Mycena indigotica]KAF7311937.1 Oxalate decarboxylase [Mycena indigotica]